MNRKGVVATRFKSVSVDLIFAFFFGLPCHYLLFYGVHTENKRYLSPFLVFYCTNFMLNVIFSAVTIIAAAVDVRRLLFGQVRYDFGWIAFQVYFVAVSLIFSLSFAVFCIFYVLLIEKEHEERKRSQLSKIFPTNRSNLPRDMRS